MRFDREFVLEQLKLAPAQITVPGATRRAVTLGGGTLCMLPPGGSPFVADRERGRRDGTYGDHVELVKMTQATPLLRCGQCGACEASDLPETSRHLDLDYSWLRYSDKPFVAYGTSGPRARDSVELAAISCGGRAAIEAEPAIIGVVNPNSPLVWDFLMVDAMWGWAEANQPIAMTPFLLAGATAPVSVAAGLSLQVAEALSGVAIAQPVRPGVGCFFGSFFSARRHAQRRPVARPCRSRCSGRSPAASSRAATACRSAAAAGSPRPTPSTRRPRRSRRCRCGAPTSPAATSCCTRPAGSRAA